MNQCTQRRLFAACSVSKARGVQFVPDNIERTRPLSGRRALKRRYVDQKNNNKISQSAPARGCKHSVSSCIFCNLVNRLVQPVFGRDIMQNIISEGRAFLLSFSFFLDGVRCSDTLMKAASTSRFFFPPLSPPGGAPNRPEETMLISSTLMLDGNGAL